MGRIQQVILVLGVILRLLRSWPRLRKEGEEAIHAARAAYLTAWQALEDRHLTQEEVREARRKLEALGQEVEDVVLVLAPILGMGKEDG